MEQTTLYGFHRSRESIRSNSGLRQGCVLSPLLFIIFMDNIMKRANQEENSIEELMFADDLVLIAEDKSE